MSSKAGGGWRRQGRPDKRRWLWRPGLLAFALVLHGCGANLPPLADTPVYPYRLGSGDTIRLIVFGEDPISGQYRVNDVGTIALPLVGTVRAAGLTTDQLQTALAGELARRNLLRAPSVSVEVVTFRPIFVLGEVAKPGQYAYQPGMSVLTAVALAGGFTYSANKDRAVVQRNEGDRTVEGFASRRDRVHPGDIITIRERYF
jgi:polysaccharide export outer membrane protein